MKKIFKTNSIYKMEFGKANLVAFFIGVALLSILFLAYHIIWDIEKITSGIKKTWEYFLPILIAGILIHELLHGITWAAFASQGMKSIRFGFKWKYLTPYCHCTEPLKVKHYKLAVLMPLLVLGILPLLFGIFTGNGAVFFWGAILANMAAGDIIVLFSLRKLDNQTVVSDAPDAVGFYTKTIPKVDVDIEQDR